MGHAIGTAGNGAIHVTLTVSSPPCAAGRPYLRPTRIKTLGRSIRRLPQSFGDYKKQVLVQHNVEEHLTPGSRRRPGASSRYRSVRRLRVFRKVYGERGARSKRDVGPSDVGEGHQSAALLLVDAGEGGRSKFRPRGVRTPQIEPRIMRAASAPPSPMRVAHRPRAYISALQRTAASPRRSGRP